MGLLTRLDHLFGTSRFSFANMFGHSPPFPQKRVRSRPATCRGSASTAAQESALGERMPSPTNEKGRKVLGWRHKGEEYAGVQPITCHRQFSSHHSCAGAGPGGTHADLMCVCS